MRAATASISAARLAHVDACGALHALSSLSLRWRKRVVARHGDLALRWLTPPRRGLFQIHLRLHDPAPSSAVSAGDDGDRGPGFDAAAGESHVRSRPDSALPHPCHALAESGGRTGKEKRTGSAGRSNIWTKKAATPPICDSLLFRIRFPAPPRKVAGFSLDCELPIAPGRFQAIGSKHSGSGVSRRLSRNERDAYGAVSGDGPLKTTQSGRCRTSR